MRSITGFRSRWAIGLLVVCLLLAAAIDVVMNLRSYRSSGPTQLANVTVALGLLTALRWHVAGALLASGGSIFASLWYAQVELGSGRLPGAAEAFGLALLAAAPAYITHRRDRWVISAAAVSAAAALAIQLRNPSELRILILAGILLAFGSGLYVSSAAGEHQARLELARSEERAAIARDLHDVVAHHVTAIVVRAQAGQMIGGDDATAALVDIERAGSQALASMRSMVASLRRPGDGPLSPTGNLDELRQLARPAGPGAPEVRVEIEPGVENAAAVTLEATTRIAAEAVTNALRHARNATAVSVRVTRRDRAVVVEVANDGTPAVPRPGGFGLLGMGERAAALGGTLHAGPQTGGGWLVEARLPASSALMADAR